MTGPGPAFEVSAIIDNCFHDSTAGACHACLANVVAVANELTDALAFLLMNPNEGTIHIARAALRKAGR